MIVKLLTEHHLEFLSLKRGCRGSSESVLVKMPHCWKSHVTAQLCDKAHYLLGWPKLLSGEKGCLTPKGHLISNKWPYSYGINSNF